MYCISIQQLHMLRCLISNYSIIHHCSGCSLQRSGPEGNVATFSTAPKKLGSQHGQLLSQFRLCHSDSRHTTVEQSLQEAKCYKSQLSRVINNRLRQPREPILTDGEEIPSKNGRQTNACMHAHAHTIQSNLFTTEPVPRSVQ